ncbi:MAG: heme ABC exporter ATP-binding protein CcmA [Dehalococcoidales bacterium]|nr:MAG: heme ABC exporter ATP-binding protein CcmA [Dehalococcoidales bacterium]
MMSDSIPLSSGVEVQELTKTFGNNRALRGIDLQVTYGDFLIIFGPNGAGKTTLLKILATIMKPSSGEVRIGGLDLKKDAEEIRRRVGVVTHQTFLYNNLTARENLEFYSRMYDVAEARQRIHEVVNTVGMATRLNDRVSTLSRGMQQRLSIARALLHKPDIMLLDEPETGLDQEALPMLWQALQNEEQKKRTVVMTTHNLERSLELGNHLVILAKGKIVHEQTGISPDLSTLRKVYEETTR